MISLRKKRFVFTSIALLLVCFSVIFFSLIRLSTISREVEKERFRYLKTFTNFYSSILKTNINEFITQTKFFVKDLSEKNLKEYLQTKEENLNKTPFNKSIVGFFHLTDAVSRIEITYWNKEEDKLWFIPFYTILHESGRWYSMIREKYEIIEPQEKMYFWHWLNANETNLLQIHPLIDSSPEEKSLSAVIIPISHTIYQKGKVTLRIKFFFNAEFLSGNIKDFKKVSKSVIEKLFVIFHTGDVLSINDEKTSSISLYSNEMASSSLYYSNWPLFSDQDIEGKEASFSKARKEALNEAKRSNIHLEIFRLEGTQKFWGVVFQISQEGFLRLNNDFFLSLSMLILSISFIFCAFYYTSSYFYIEGTHRLLEKDLLESALQFDSLTGTFTRTICQKKAIKMISDQDPFILSVLDIDYFKRVNDEYGHIVGDNVLIEMCDRIKDQLALWQNSYPLYDFCVSRWGGEEFVILISKGEEEKLKSFLEELQILLSSPSGQEGIPPYTVSMGASFLANYTKKKREPSEIFKFLFKEADLALYDAKQAGRNQIVFYSSTEEEIIV